MNPYCPKDEWTGRAERALESRMAAMSVPAVADAVAHLWEEACDLSPEEAVDIYVTEHPE